MAHNNNPNIGSFAIVKSSHKVVFLTEAIKGQQYECPKCEEDVIFRHGHKNRPHFCHKNRTDCSNYATESEIHMEAKQLLENLL
jgi:competence protein CoiA